MRLPPPLLLKISLFLSLFFFPLRSLGVCLQPDPTLVCEYLNSDAVFVGTVVSAKPAPPRDPDLAGTNYKLSVQQWFRGPHTEFIEVFTELSSGRRSLDVGKQYLLFVFQSNGRLEIDGCGNSTLSPSASLTNRLRSLVVPQDAVIEARISLPGIPDTTSHPPDIEILLRGGGKVFTAKMDKRGWFHLHVPPGKYSAEIVNSGATRFTSWDLSHDHPDHFEARPGHCSGLQFQPAAN